MTAARYAIYYAPPPGSALWWFGSSVLGYDAASGETRQPLAPAGVPVGDWTAMTAQPRRYGFHGTLKAPFRLADGASEDDLVSAGRAFARKLKSFALPDLEVAALDTFAALSTVSPSPQLDALAAACVEAFEPFRAPLSPEELARRLDAPLSDRQRSALKRWGYPFVFDDFHFHMTLTGSLEAADVPHIVDGCAELYEEHVGAASTTVDAVTLYVEENPAVGFRIVDRFVFGST